MATPPHASNRPTLIIQYGNLPATAREVADLVAKSGEVYNRSGVPVRLAKNPCGGLPSVHRLTPEGVVLLVHELANPIKKGERGEEIPQTLPTPVGKLYLEILDKGLPILNGITTAPIISPNGEIFWQEGYHAPSGIYCAGLTSPQIHSSPSRVDAQTALALIRETFCTFPFADATIDRSGPSHVVDQSALIGQDESAFLCALLTAVCRASLPLAPGLLIAAPSISGAGTGKGKLVRAISLIAHGMEPSAFTAGQRMEEFDKQLDSALFEGFPLIFIDNMNSGPNRETLRSAKLSSILTERTLSIRPLGTTGMLLLKPNAFLAITGNGLSVSEDLVRRFLLVKLDARMEDPESRPFPPGFLDRIKSQRSELLAMVLTILRWGLQNAASLKRGRPLGSFEEWAQWVRDPLFTLGCADPVSRLKAIKNNDPERARLVEIFTVMHHHHGSDPVAAADLHDDVRGLINPVAPSSRQAVAAFVDRHAGSTVNGMTLVKYARNTPSARHHYAIRVEETQPDTPMPPMMPMV